MPVITHHVYTTFNNIPAPKNVTCFIQIDPYIHNEWLWASSQTAEVSLEYCSVYCPLFTRWTSCSALFIDGCGALIRLKHTGLRSHLGVIIGLGGGITRTPPPLLTTSIKVKNDVESGGKGGGRQRGAKERFNPGLSLIYLAIPLCAFSLSAVHKKREFLLFLSHKENVRGSIASFI